MWHFRIDTTSAKPTASAINSIVDTTLARRRRSGQSLHHAFEHLGRPGDHVALEQVIVAAAEITDQEEVASPDVVKAITAFGLGLDVAVARDFVRQVPPGAVGPFWHHIGIYAYRREALEKFVSLPVSPRERDRKLEQMRAMDNAMPIAVVRVDTVPFGVDTPADLERARREIGSAPDAI